MTRQLLIWTVFLTLTAVTAHGQTFVIKGTWKSPRAIAVRQFTFDSNDTFKQDDYGDISDFHFTGHYSVRKDSIYLTYDSTTNYQNKKHHPANDTLFIINKNVIKVNNYLYIFNKERGEQTFSVDKNGVLNCKIKTFGDTLFLQQERFYKWVTVDTFVGSDSVEIKEYQLQLHSGINKFHIKSEFSHDWLKQFEITSTKDKIKIESKKITDKIQFSGQTYYELYDKYSKLIKKGVADSIDCSNLPTGKYILNYDNDWTEIKKI